MNTFDGRYWDRTNFTSSEYLHINSCGVNRLDFPGHNSRMRIYRPDGRVDFHLLLVTRGELQILMPTPHRTLTEGMCMVYYPDTPQEYAFTATENAPRAESLWVHFCGTAVPEIMQKAGILCSGPINPFVTGEIKRIFEHLLRAHRMEDEITACGHLLRLIARLSPERKMPEGEIHRRIRAEAEYISNHYPEEIDLDTCASRCCLSRSRFAHLFTQLIGTSPRRYQLNLRMEQAQDLLAWSTLNVSEIAAQLGFADALYFSRLFRKYYNTSPSEFRNAPEIKRTE